MAKATNTNNTEKTTAEKIHVTTRELLDEEIKSMNDSHAIEVSETARAYLKDYNKEKLTEKYVEWAQSGEPIKTALKAFYFPRYAIKRDSKTNSYALSMTSKQVDIIDYIEWLRTRGEYKKFVENIPTTLKFRSENLCIALALRESAKTAREDDEEHKAKKAAEIINYYKRSKSNTVTAVELSELSNNKFYEELEKYFRDILPTFVDRKEKVKPTFLAKDDKIFIESAFTGIDKKSEHSLSFAKPELFQQITVKVLHKIITNGYYGDSFSRSDSSYYQTTTKKPKDENEELQRLENEVEKLGRKVVLISDYEEYLKIKAETDANTTESDTTAA